MSQTFGDVMKAQRNKRIALIIKARMGPPPPPDYTDSGNAKEQGTKQNPMRAGKKTLETDFAFDETNPKSVEAVRRQAADLVTNVSDTTRSQIRELVEQAFTDPEMDVTSLADEIEGIVNDPDRAELIARTETMAASNAGQQDAWDQAQEDGLLNGNEQKEWISTSDERCCDICDDLDGESVGVNETFDVDGDDLDGPPAHPNCRCTVGLNS